LPSLCLLHSVVSVPVLIYVALKLRSGGSLSPKSQAYDPKTGLGRGAPGFQTNIKRIAVPPEIMARIRAGEEVSAEEITAAQDKMRREEEKKATLDEVAASSAAKKKKRGVKR
jgi:protoporphyrinogen oxidase